jgi:hypothetical protein
MLVIFGVELPGNTSHPRFAVPVGWNEVNYRREKPEWTLGSVVGIRI